VDCWSKRYGQPGPAFRTNGMLQKKLFSALMLLLVASLMPLTGCSTGSSSITAPSAQPPTSPTGGSNGNPQMTTKKESGGT
jgi:ABC-type oligopeptide transport system substrate-binding subunit